MNNNQPILVTGAHRSGTTWVGKMLSINNQIAYISEPLNVLHRSGVFNQTVEHWYTYICGQNENLYLPSFRNILEFRYHLGAEIKSIRSGKDFLRMCRDWVNFSTAKFFDKRPLLKDPFAVFSIEWFAHRLDCHTIVVIRHPAAFTSSLKRLKWSFDFTDLLSQPLLMQDWLEPYREEMITVSDTNEDIILQSSLLWRMIYKVVTELQKKTHNINVVRHEDLSLDPIEGFSNLYQILDINLTKSASEKVVSSSSTVNPSELSPSSVHSTKLNSRANIDNWKHRLTKDEIKRIQQLTADVSINYYSEQDWL